MWHLLGILGLSLFKMGGSIKTAIDNESAKQESLKYVNGFPAWWDSEGNYYINGERVIFQHDITNGRRQYIGLNTGRVYWDSDEEGRREAQNNNNKEKQLAINSGKLAYNKYDYDKRKYFTCEISTGRYIHSLIGDEYGKYYKYYEMPNSCYDKREISYEEFNKLNIKNGRHFIFQAYSTPLITHSGMVEDDEHYTNKYICSQDFCTKTYKKGKPTGNVLIRKGEEITRDDSGILHTSNNLSIGHYKGINRQYLSFSTNKNIEKSDKKQRIEDNLQQYTCCENFRVFNGRRGSCLCSFLIRKDEILMCGENQILHTCEGYVVGEKSNYANYLKRGDRMSRYSKEDTEIEEVREYVCTKEFTFTKQKNTFLVRKGEKILCVIPDILYTVDSLQIGNLTDYKAYLDRR